MENTYRGRREDDRFLRGEGRYTSDWSIAGQAYAAFRRSEVAHARIVSVDASRAIKSRGTVAVLTADNFPSAFGTLAPPMSYQGRGGARIAVPQRPLLARDRVRFVGEEIALAVAESHAQACDAAEHIEVEYEELRAVTGVEQALAPGAPPVHESIPGNVCFDFDYGDDCRTGEALGVAPRRVCVSVASPRVSAAPMEPRSVLAWYDEARETYEIRCSNQGGTGMAEQLATLLRTRPDRIRVHMVDVGGGFGPRSSAYPEYAILLEAARKLRRPIKWISSRSEEFLCDSHGRGIRLRGELGFDRHGRFLALRTDWICDQGAYLTYAGPHTNCFNGLLIATGPYRIDALYGRHRLVMTNTAPTNAYRGAARPEAALIIERLVDEAAAALRLDPIEIRRRNALRPSDLPFRTATGSEFDSGDFPALLENAERVSRWHEFESRRKAAEAQGALRGIGCALFVEPCGGGFVDEDEVRLVFEEDGQIIAYVATTPNGQGHETVFPEVVAARLGIDASRVTLRSSDPDGPPIRGNGTISSRSAMAQGSALACAAAQAVDKGKAIAAEILEVAVSDVDFVRGEYRVRGTDMRLPVDSVLREAGTRDPNPLDTALSQRVPRSFTVGAHIAEIEIDRQTGKTAIVSYVAVDDVGNVIHPVIAHGQIHGGVAQAAGQVLGEECVYDETSGQLLAGSFMDYAIPHADTMPSVESRFCGSSSPSNALGAKGIGETGATGGLPALMNAVMDAMRNAGVTIFDMPATPHRVWLALRSASGRR